MLPSGKSVPDAYGCVERQPAREHMLRLFASVIPIHSFLPVGLQCVDSMLERHLEVLSNVRRLIDELEHLDSELEVIGNVENEDLPPKGEFFLSLTVDGDDGPTLTRMGVENGKLYLVLSKDARSSQLAVLDLGRENLVGPEP